MIRPLAGWFAAILFVGLGHSSALASPPSDSLLPATTKGYLSIPNLGALREQFNRSQFGKLANDPALQPFVEDFKRQLRQQGIKQLEQLGLSWDELEDLPSGEVALAAVQISPDAAAVVIMIDFTGHIAQAETQLAKIGERLTQSGAKRLQQRTGDQMVVYQLPGDPGRREPPTAAYFLQQNILVASDSVPLLQGMLHAVNDGREDSLVGVQAYHEIMSRCTAAANGLAPNLRWFIEPFGYAEALRAATPLREKHKGPDLIKVFKNQGFTAIQGVGGFVNFSDGKYEVLHRTMIYAPPIAGRDPHDVNKYNLAARMLRFPAGGDLLPPAWVPHDVATCTSFNLDIHTAFTVVSSMVDEMVGEKGVFSDVLDSLRDDPDGPRVDVSKELVAHLGARVTIISDYELPIGPKSERKVLAVETTDEQTVATAIAKLMGAEKTAHRREFEGHVIWELIDAQSEMPKLEIETPGVSMQHSESDVPVYAADKRFLSTTAVCVANGQLFLSSHIALLKKVLQQASRTDGLSTADDYRLIAAQAAVVGADPLSFRLFSRSDQEFRPTYELIRTGQMPQSETILGKILNSMSADAKDGVPRKQRIDGHQLPEFAAIQKYLGPAGSFVTSLDDGWMCVGLMLPPQPIVVNAPADAQLPSNAADQVIPKVSLLKSGSKSSKSDANRR
ncbi:MAG TPA: hypothetical protein VFE46_04695 [Pirellulales bacterium]|jgi:hypothetical protein|nr:hypothetical protein [Pirellulales bacterium]